ncbi:hypothetical protein EX30DRAFT_5815 [Ascodesmis nigricans]|uniref:SWIM-type domain-containing protein n=1 Tax=Ascodesmis nigricans TaxID=341454 RepID=A0A4V3SJP1_9PEZI|nr:hypothetical protein EX30DRAFT_5815 [Ascodesmis nigricans]
MASTLLSISISSLALRDRLFSLDSPVHLTTAEFTEVWPLIDSVYTLKKTENLQNGDLKRETGECRLRKSRVSSKAKPDVDGQPRKKRRLGSTARTRPAGKCAVTIRIDHDLPAGMVVVRRVNRCGEGHRHTMEESFKTKMCSKVRDACIEERKKGLLPSEVLRNLRAVEGKDGGSRLEEIGGASLNLTFIYNCRRFDATKTAENDEREPDPSGPGKSETSTSHTPTPFENDIAAASSHLLSNGWLFHQFHVPSFAHSSASNPQRGLIFAKPQHINLLIRRGHLILLSSTPILTNHSHNLHTFLARDESGSWILIASAILPSTTANSISECLRTLQRWTSNRWRPRYIITPDTSLATKHAIRLSFPGPNPVTHLLCTLHTRRILHSRLGGTKSLQPALQDMLHALWSTTPAQCETKIRNAINKTPDSREEVKTYLREKWLGTATEWGMFARQHGPLLLQIHDTIPCERWWGSLRLGNGTMSIQDVVGDVVRATGEVEKIVEARVLEFRTRRVEKAVGVYSGIGKLPFPAQRLLLRELKACSELSLIDTGESNDEDIEDVPIRALTNQDPINDSILDNDKNSDVTLHQHPNQPRAHCTCLFSRQYLLPCRHIFQLDLQLDKALLDSVQWELYASLFANGGMEIYETLAPYKTPESVPTLPQNPPLPSCRIGVVIEEWLRESGQFISMLDNVFHATSESLVAAGVDPEIQQERMRVMREIAGREMRKIVEELERVRRE